MLPCSMVLCPEVWEEGGGKTAFIDQRAVAAGKNAQKLHFNFKNSFKLIFLDIMAIFFHVSHVSVAFTIWAVEPSKNVQK